MPASHSEADLAVIIVTFFPDIEGLERLLCALAGSGYPVFIFDNNSDNSAAITALAAQFSVALITSQENIGLAAALNRTEAALPANIRGFVAFDQDSEPEPGYIDVLAELWRSAGSDLPPVAAVGGWVIDLPDRQNLGFFTLRGPRAVALTPRDGVAEPDWLIISGTLYDRSALQVTGRFDEQLFVDNVDLEWSYRARGYGYRLLGTDRASMLHQLGEQSIALPGLAWHVKVHAPERLAIMTRSRVLSYRKRSIPAIWKWHDLLRFLVKSSVMLLFAAHRWQRMRAIIRGIKEGIGASIEH